jgi:hypothetical protein
VTEPDQHFSSLTFSRVAAARRCRRCVAARRRYRPGCTRTAENQPKDKKERLAIKLFHIIEGEADGRFAISALLIMVFGALAWRLLA